MAISSSTTRGISLFCRIVTTIAALIVLGITAWAVESTKTVTVIYSLTVVSASSWSSEEEMGETDRIQACLTVLYIIVIACMSFLAYRKTIFHVISSVMELFLAFL